MTTKSAKTTRATGDGIVGTSAESDATPGGRRAGTGGTKAKPANTPTKTPKARHKAAVGDGEAKAERAPRTDTKQAKLIAMLKAKDGATVEEIAAPSAGRRIPSAAPSTGH